MVTAPLAWGSKEPSLFMKQFRRLRVGSRAWRRSRSSRAGARVAAGSRRRAGRSRPAGLPIRLLLALAPVGWFSTARPRSAASICDGLRPEAVTCSAQCRGTAKRLAVSEPLVIPARFWCRGAESNCRHRGFQPRALPTELPRRRSHSRSGPSAGQGRAVRCVTALRICPCQLLSDFVHSGRPVMLSSWRERTPSLCPRRSRPACE